MSWHTVAVSWPPSRPYCACAQPYRGRVVAHGQRVVGLCRDTKSCRRPLPITIQNLYRNPSPCYMCSAHRVARAAVRVTAPNAVSWRIAAPYRSPGALYRDPKSPPQPRYNFLYRNSPPSGQALARARGLLALRAGRQFCGHAGRVMGHPTARPNALCHNTACCFVTQAQKMGSSPAYCLPCFFFPFFFHCSNYYKTIKIYIYNIFSCL